MIWRNGYGPLRVGEPTPGGGTPPAFDAAAFMTTLKGEFQTIINGAVKGIKEDVTKVVDLKLKEWKPPEVTPPGTPPPGTPPGTPPPGTPPGTPPSPELVAMQNKFDREMEVIKKQNKDLADGIEKERTQRFETERTAQIKTVLADIPFANDASRNVFFNAMNAQIKRDEAGSLVADTDKGPMEFGEYLRSQAQAMPNLLMPSGSGGGGANGGRPAGGKAAPDIFKLSASEISKLSEPEQAQIRQEISQALVPR